MSYVKKIPKEPTFMQNGLNGYQFDLDKKGLEISYIDCFKGHDKYCRDTESTLIYYVLEGKGQYVINNEKLSVQKGDVVEVPVNAEFVYAGNMKLILIMTPGFKPENNIEIKDNDLY